MTYKHVLYSVGLRFWCKSDSIKFTYNVVKHSRLTNSEFLESCVKTE